MASCKYIGQLEAAIDNVIEGMKIAPGSRVCLYGDRDEIYQMLRGRLARARASVLYAGCPDELDPGIDAILVWQHDSEEELKNKNMACVNILESN